ncbi:MAG: hypothetical protein ON057_000521 [Glomeribacter sp. 1016415]|nr:hypothetical protein [Glomeribacter sp. 1016415]
MYPTSRVATATAQSQVSTILDPIANGRQAFNIAQNCLKSGDYENALRSLDVMKKSFGDALTQNKVRPSAEEHQIKAQLAQAYLVSGDILCNLRRVDEARTNYEAALQYGALEAEQKLSSLQNVGVERDEVVIQVAAGLAGQTVDGSGHETHLHFNPTERDHQLLAETIKQQPTLEMIMAALPKVRAGKGGRTVVQFSTGAANITTSGENNKTTTIWGRSNVSDTTPGANPTNFG